MVMKRRLTVGILLISATLIVFAFIAIQFFDGGYSAIANSRRLARLFEDLGVLELPHNADPIVIRLQDIHGNPVSLSDFRGKIVFLNFWTTWCPTCLTEMPSMEKLHQKFKNKDFAMVTVNIRESTAKVAQFFKKFKLTFVALLDSTGEVAIGLKIRSIPTTFIIDKGGRAVGFIMGPREWDGKQAVALFEYLTERNAATTKQILIQ